MLMKIVKYLKKKFLDRLSNIIYITINLISELSSIFKDDFYFTLSTLRENKNFEYQFFSNKFKESHHKWKNIYKELKDNQKILHNISYNYWKRSYQSRSLQNKIYNKNPLQFIRIVIFLFYLFIFFIKFIRYLFLGACIQFDQINKGNKKTLSTKKIAFTAVGQYRYSLVNSLFKNINRPIYDVTIKNFLTKSKNDNNNDKKFLYIKKNEIYKSFFVCLKYIYRQKIIIRYANSLFDSYLIYYHFSKCKINKFFNNKKYSSISHEAYSMLMRSLALGSIDSANSSIIKTEYTDTDNDYSYNNIFRKEFKTFTNTNFSTKSKLFAKKNSGFKLNNKILIQSSDSLVSFPSLYEFKCYEHLAYIFSRIQSNDEIIICFHPANKPFSVFLKKMIWKINFFKFNIKNRIIFSHRSSRIDDLFANSRLLISISDSRALFNAIQFGLKSALFDYTNFFIKSIKSDPTYKDLYIFKEYRRLFFTIQNKTELIEFIDSDNT